MSEPVVRIRIISCPRCEDSHTISGDDLLESLSDAQIARGFHLDDPADETSDETSGLLATPPPGHAVPTFDSFEEFSAYLLEGLDDPGDDTPHSPTSDADTSAT